MTVKTDGDSGARDSHSGDWQQQWRLAVTVETNGDSGDRDSDSGDWQ